MKKTWRVCMVLMGALILSGCGSKFEPTESTVFITKNGTVQSAVMEPFEETYYDFDELTEDVTASVQSYCLDANEDSITLESLTEENRMVTLLMNYKTVKDYTDFNDVVLFSGTLTEAKEAGYEPGELYDAEGQVVELTPEEEEKLKVIVTEESICVQTSGRIKCVSDNVTITDKKLAKAFEAGPSHLAFVIYK